MKHSFVAIALSMIAAFAPTAAADDFVNLTPKPKSMTVAQGSLALPSEFSISASGISADMQAEIDKFAAALNKATGINVVPSAPALFSVELNSDLAAEGYKLSITADGVSIEAATPAGLFYAFQTIKKILPPNVAVGVADTQASYSLPLVKITDEPRYNWRGMEIDCARHFFSIAELKKMIDIMAVYKMNRLHWHLTDDQGWRLEMPKYPKLTTAAAAPENNYWWDFDNHSQFMLNEQYGPYYYTVDEMKDLVAYAKERHIEICPEIDMPGHMQCAIAAYPEFSTTPDGDHPVRYWPGVSTDILDVSNPAVVQFTKDIIDELAAIFPYEYIHVGGDECPTTAWANSPSCQAFKKEYGLKSDRAIQNWLFKELADHAAEKHNRRLICWNEVITADGADKEMIKNADVLIYAWLNPGAANNPSKQAADLGLRSVWCSTHHYYLDYPQWSGNSEPRSMGFTITLETVYNVAPDFDATKKDLYYGVNCNLWTEYICEDKHLEYNALPRMIAVAETGWTPSTRKNFTDFRRRFNADTEMLDLGNYTYGRHYVDAVPEVVAPADGKFYRIVTQASADENRRDRCIELVADGCPLISQKNASVGKLWTNNQAAEGSHCYDYQFWTFEADPNGSGKYAMVNKAAPEGSVSPDMVGSSIEARWNYDYSTKHYNFVVGEHFGVGTNGYTYSIRSDKDSGWWLNCAQSGQNQTVNNWHSPTDGNGGIWLFYDDEFAPASTEPATPAFTPLTSGNYAISNALGRGALAANADGSLVVAPEPAYANIGWTITAGDYNESENSQTITLRNMATGLYVSGLSESAVSTTTGIGFAGYADNGGFEVLLGQEPATITLTRSKDSDDEEFVLTLGGKNIFAFSADWIHDPCGVNANANAPRKQAATWTIAPVGRAVKATTSEGTFFHYDLEGAQPLSPLGIPAFEPFANFRYVSETVDAEPQADGHIAAQVEIERVSNTVTYVCRDAEGTTWATVSRPEPVGAEPSAPEFDWMTFERMGQKIADNTYEAIYSTTALKGVRRVNATELVDGAKYYIEDIHSVRHAFRKGNASSVGGQLSVAPANEDQSLIWVLEKSGNGFAVKNLGNGKYVQQVNTSTNPVALGTNPYAFIFTENNGYWTIKNSTNNNCWDGLEDLTMVGWNAPGHPYCLYPVDEVEPMFSVTIEERDSNGELLSSKVVYVEPGASYMFAASSRPSKALTDVTGNEGLDCINSNKLITVVYTLAQDAINEIHADQSAGPRGIFDLNGRRLSKVGRPGIYIINGVKTLVK